MLDIITIVNSSATMYIMIMAHVSPACTHIGGCAFHEQLIAEDPKRVNPDLQV